MNTKLLAIPALVAVVGMLGIQNIKFASAQEPSDLISNLIEQVALADPRPHPIQKLKAALMLVEEAEEGDKEQKLNGAIGAMTAFNNQVAALADVYAEQDISQDTTASWIEQGTLIIEDLEALLGK